MSGYGSADDHLEVIESVVLNGIDVARASLPTGESAFYCQDDACGEEIPEKRRQAIKGCQHCVHCAPKYEVSFKIRALDHIL